MEKKLLKLTNDVVFRVVYGRENEDSERALLSMLNVILDRREDPIRKIIYKNPVVLIEAVAAKESILDIKVETEIGEILDVEMQVIVDDTYRKRSIFYQAKNIAESLKRGETYQDLRKTISINILKSNLFKNHNNVHSIYRYVDIDTGDQLTDISEIHFIELDKINPKKKAFREMSELELLGAYIKYVGVEGRESYVEELREMKKEVIKMSDKVLDDASRDEALRCAAISREMWEHDEATRKYLNEHAKEIGEKEGREKGLREGREEGKQEGEKQAKIETAIRLKAAGVDLKTIEECVGLTIKEIKKL